jgi:hypothetical protein
MKRLHLGILAIMMLVMSGCGGGSVEVVVPIAPVTNPPSITSHSFTKNTATEIIYGDVAFYAPDSDIYSMTVVVFDPSGQEKSRITTFPNLTGIAQGTIPYSIDYINFSSDFYNPYTFSIYLTDFNGYTSNQAVDTFFVP